MEQKLKISFLIGITFVLLGYVSVTIYRPYILEHMVPDFGLVDYLPSLFYVIGFSQILLIRPIRYPVVTIGIVTLGSVIYEIKQAYFGSTFDLPDTIASLVGGAVSVGILYLINRRYNHQNHEK